MTTFRILDFESLIRDFLTDKKSWDDVHKFVTESEWNGETDFPSGTPTALSELYFAFLADSKDDPQFLGSKQEVQDFLDGLQDHSEH